MLFILVTLFYVLQGSTQATPSASPTLQQPSSSHESPLAIACSFPDQRSVWDILWSCLATIFACSWVAVHPDIPDPDERWPRIALRRMEYMFWTIMTPELMIYWAARQWFGARHFFNHPFYGKLQQNIDRYGWTSVHAHFLQMGGFTLFDGKVSKGVLSRDRLRALVERGKVDFPEITLKEIEDRSKSDGLSKLLAIEQTTWFVLQVLARRIQGMVITEIEIATLAFAALNATMYFFWWNKPYDVRTSVPVWLLRSKQNAECEQNYDSQDIANPPVGDYNGHPFDEAVIPKNRCNLKEELIRLFAWPRRAVRSIAQRLHNVTENYEEFNHFQSIETSDATCSGSVPPFYAIIATENEERKMNILVAITGAIFGAIHCAGWSFEFSSAFELNLWRAGSLAITGIPVLFLVLMATVNGVLKPISPHYRKGIQGFIRSFIIPIFFRVFFPLYALSRIALIVEAFLALRHLPQGAKTVVAWTTFLPHV